MAALEPAGDSATPEMQCHPAAAVWPMLPDDELRALADDIKANGLHQPIVCTPDGQLLAGRNRLAACALIGVKPTTVVYDGDPFAFVISENGYRGHYSTGQRAMATALVLHQQGKRKNGRWTRGSVPADNGSSSNSDGWVAAMKRAGLVLDETPELALAVVAGSQSLDVAHKAASDRRQFKTEAAQKVADGFGRAVHLLAAFDEATATITEFVATYAPPALPVDADDLARALRALTAIATEWRTA